MSERLQKIERGGMRFQRRERTSVSDLTHKVLNLPNVPEGMVARVVNDVEDRVERMKELGYMPYEHREGAEVNSTQQTTTLGSVWNKSVGGGTRGVLMVIPKEWYDENQKHKQNRLDETEAQLQHKAEADGMTQNLGGGHMTSGISIRR